MLDKLIRFSLDNRVTILAIAVLLLIVGSFVVSKMEVDVFPDLNAPTVVVMTEAPGMAPEEVERLVTFPVETAVNGATDVRRVRSSSTTGFSVVWVEFDWGTNIFTARQIVSEKLSAINEQLPPEVGNPTLGPQSSILGEIMIIGLTADSVTSMEELRTLADWTLRPRLLSTGGVAQVSVLGGDVKEYRIALDPNKMKHYGVGLDEVVAAVDGMNRNSSGGVLYEYGNEYIIRGMLSTNRIGEMGKALVKKIDGVPVVLEDIAEMGTGAKLPRMGAASLNGKPAVMLTITKQPNVDTKKLTEKIDASLNDIRINLPPDVHISTDIYRQSRFIDNAIHNVVDALLMGGLFVVIVLIVFLMNARTTLISLVTIPISVLTTFVVVKLMGLTINTMSLGGLAIAVGSLVDDSIVDVENVFKRLRENRMKPQNEQKSVLQVVFNASREVRRPIWNSTLIVVVSFIPLFFLQGMEERMLIPLGLTFVMALFASTAVSLTLTPVLCSYLLGSERSDPLKKDPFLVRILKTIYRNLLESALFHRKGLLIGVGAALVVSVFMLLSFGKSFLPPFNEGSFTINVSTLPGVSLDESDKIGKMAEDILLSIPEIQVVGRKTGRAELDEHALGVNVSEIEAPYELKGRTKEEVIAEIREKMKVIPGVNIEIGSPVSHRIDAMLSGTQANIAVKLFGPDLNKMYRIGNQIKTAISNIDGVVDLNVEQQVERPQLKIVPKREILAKYGISLPEFNEAIGVLLEGKPVSQVYEGDRSFDLILRVKDKDRESVEAIGNLAIDADGQKVPLCQVADIVSSAGPHTINRENVSRKMVVSANITGRDLQGAVDDIRNTIENEIRLPEGYHVEYGGQFESARSASRTLTLASVLSVLTIFLLLFAEFKSWPQAAIAMVNLPLSLIGGVFIVFFTGGVMNIPSIIGFISLFGIATRNGVLLLNRYNDLHAAGLSVHDTIIQGSLDRLNPILMTALSSALALVPMALSGHLPGNEIQSPMAKVILGGLITSTALNGFIIPVMYGFIAGKDKKKQEKLNDEQ
ncbi:MAG TPA: efflux RND transporter permease subunit [Dysgonamonadaceae bacterium]|jgi:CzcA family heavy metal efflux pump|nr:efflux RND transporter permease subunit [Dysgonamonadaceae bacterium]